MGTEESNRSPTSCKIVMAQDENLDKPLPPHWSTSMQAHQDSGSATTPFLNPYAASFSFHPYMWPNQAYSTPLQIDSLQDPRRLFNRPVVTQGTVLTILEKAHTIASDKQLDSMKICDKNLQPRRPIIKKSRENGNGSSMHKNDRDGASCSSASASRGSSDEGYDTNNDFLTKKQQFNTVLGNGKVAEKVAIENCNTVHVNRNSAVQGLAVNSIEPNPKLGTGVNVIGANPQLTKLDENEIRKERKRQLNRESARRSRIRKQLEFEELKKFLDGLRRENSSLKDRLMTLSEHCVELTDKNNSIEEELVEMYGPESIADLLAKKPA